MPTSTVTTIFTLAAIGGAVYLVAKYASGDTKAQGDQAVAGGSGASMDGNPLGVTGVPTQFQPVDLNGDGVTDAYVPIGPTGQGMGQPDPNGAGTSNGTGQGDGFTQYDPRIVDSDGDGTPDAYDPYPFDPYNGGGNNQGAPDPNKPKTPDDTTSRDSDGDGVPDQYDADPYNPNIQTQQQLIDYQNKGIKDATSGSAGGSPPTLVDNLITGSEYALPFVAAPLIGAGLKKLFGGSGKAAAVKVGAESAAEDVASAAANRALAGELGTAAKAAGSAEEAEAAAAAGRATGFIAADDAAATVGSSAVIYPVAIGAALGEAAVYGLHKSGALNVVARGGSAVGDVLGNDVRGRAAGLATLGTAPFQYLGAVATGLVGGGEGSVGANINAVNTNIGRLFGGNPKPQDRVNITLYNAQGQAQSFSGTPQEYASFSIFAKAQGYNRTTKPTSPVAVSPAGTGPNLGQSLQSMAQHVGLPTSFSLSGLAGFAQSIVAPPSPQRSLTPTQVAAAPPQAIAAPAAPVAPSTPSPWQAITSMASRIVAPTNPAPKPAAPTSAAVQQKTQAGASYTAGANAYAKSLLAKFHF